MAVSPEGLRQGFDVAELSPTPGLWEKTKRGVALGAAGFVALGTLVVCDPDGAGPLPNIPAASAGEATSDEQPQPPPRPDHCSDYENMKAGKGHPENQHWFNHLPARHGDKGYARLTLACVYKGDGRQFACLDKLWREENDGDDPSDGNDWHETNVPQAKPRSKMAAGPDDHRGQVDYGLWYIYEHRDDYKDACDALDKWTKRSPHWY